VSKRVCRKKLIAAGRYWASGGQADKIQNDLDLLGIQSDKFSGNDKSFELWRAHVEPMNVFLFVSDQWRLVVTPVKIIRQSIDMTSIHAAMEILEVKNRSECLRMLKLIQSGALEVLNK
jgi:hypothetical protein